MRSVRTDRRPRQATTARLAETACLCLVALTLLGFGPADEPPLPGPDAAVAAALAETGFAPVWQVGTPIDGVSACWQAPNRPQNMRTFFTEQGIRLVPRSGEQDWSFGLSLQAHGRDGALVSASAAELSIADGRIEYRRPGLVEWYINDATGLEQGFDLETRPAGGLAPLELHFDIDGELIGRAAEQSVSFRDAAGQDVLSYGGLIAWDSTGRDLPATLRCEGQTLTLFVDDSDARYPLTIDPLIGCLQQIVQPTPIPPNDTSFGSDVSISGDTMVVGTSGDDEIADLAGAAFVFVREFGTWVQQAKLTTTDVGKQHLFGHSVAIDGDTIVIGAPGQICCGGGVTYNTQGRAIVFNRTGTTWQQQPGMLLGLDGHNKNEFGWSVAIDGGFLVVGAPRETDPITGIASGAAYVFHDSGSWQVDQKLLPGPNDMQFAARFGIDVDIEGSRLVVGDHGDSEAPGATGAVYVFDQVGGLWTQKAKVFGSGEFGEAVALSGNRVAGGGRRTWGNCGEAGAVWVYVEADGVWSLEQKLNPTPWPCNAWFGKDVSMSGNWLAAGGGALNANRVYLFERVGSTWSETETLVADGEALCIDGSTLASSQAIFHGGTIRVFNLHGSGHSDFDVYGSGINPPGSMTMISGTPSIGGNFVLGVHNPLGTQAAGSTSVLLISLAPDPAFPAGTPLPGKGMGGQGAVGEYLLSSPLALMLFGSPWDGTQPAQFAFTLPDDPALAGFDIFIQGALLDSSPGAAVKHGLTDAIQLTIGGCPAP